MLRLIRVLPLFGSPAPVDPGGVFSCPTPTANPEPCNKWLPLPFLIATEPKPFHAMRSKIHSLAFFITLLAAPMAVHADLAPLVEESGVQGGFIVHVGVSDADETASLRTHERYQVHGLSKDEGVVAAARESLLNQGSYGSVAVAQWDGQTLPYIENLVNLLVVENAGDVSAEEIQRVLTPNGVAMVRDGDNWTKTIKKRPEEMDDWTHYYYDAKGNTTSKDMLVGPPERMQWVGSPRWSRHHDRMSSVSAMVSEAGRVYYIMDEGSRISILLPAKFHLIARDAFNGSVLWKMPIEKWSTHLWPLKSGPTQLTRRLVAGDGKVYATLGITAPVTCVDGPTGDIVRTYEDTAGAEEILLRDGVLYVLVNEDAARLNREFAVEAQSDQKRVTTEFNWDGEERTLLAIDPESGETLWKHSGKVAPITLAIDGKRVAFHDGDSIICLDAQTGEPKFEGQPAAKRQLYEYNYGPRLLLHDDVILYAGGDGTMQGIHADTGKALWDASHEKSGYRSPEDLIVAQGLVWNAGTLSGNQAGEFTGRDPVTGEVKKQFIPDVPEGTYWFHHRCYLAKATENYIIPSRTGIEYVDVDKQHWDLNHWVRGACLYGVMPANGLTYAGPHNCACYPEAKLDGMNALAPTSHHPLPEPTPDDQRLLQGPAYEKSIAEIEPAEGDWPTYRGNNSRGGFTDQKLAANLDESWELDLGGPLSTLTVANGRAYVAQIDAHTLHALNAETGEKNWHFTASARIDSPPTLWKGRVLFGSKDGHVYCLRETDGELIWRFQAAPSNLRHFAFEQLESVWPVHGSVLVEDDLVSFVSGRSCFLDGGLWFYRLNARTGEIIVKQNYDDRDPETGGDLQDRHKTLQMPVALNDILSSDGEWTYLRTQKIDKDGKRVDVGPVSGDFAKQGGAHKGPGQHLFAPMGFLDDSYFHRSYWVYGKSFAGGHGGYHQAGKYAPAGRILVHNDENVYSYGREAKYYRWTTTMEHTLYATPKEASEAAYTTEDATTPRTGNAVTSLAPGKTPAPKAKGKGKAKAAPRKPTPQYGVTFPDADAINPEGKALTLHVWVLPDSDTGIVVNHGATIQGYALILNKGKPVFQVRSDKELFVARGSEPLSEGWHHLAAVLAEDGTMTLYVDGSQVAQRKGASLVGSRPKQPLRVGDANLLVGEFKAGAYTGLIDQLVIEHQALTAEEVEQRFGQPDRKVEGAALVCTFDNGDSRDDSGNGVHGIGSGIESGKGRVSAALWFRQAPGGKKKPSQSSGSFVQHTWDRFVPMIARSMALSGNTLLVSGPPDILDEEYAFERLAAKDPSILKELAEQDAAFEGERGAKLWAVNVETGEQAGGIELDSPPVWDGVVTAQGRIYVATQDGRVQCFGKP